MTSLTALTESQPKASSWTNLPAGQPGTLPQSWEVPSPLAQLTGAGTGSCAGAADALMREPQNRFSSAMNRGIGWAMALGGYDTSRRGSQCDGNEDGTAPGDNHFYRSHAQGMPGWGNTFGLSSLDPKGLPSGAWAQDRATNYVGHPSQEDAQIWEGVRTGLVARERAALTQAQAQGKDHFSFGDLYRAHISAYAAAQQKVRGTRQGSNSFIDPASFALAAYGTPLLEHAGINTGPLTGASIDLFNDPTDRVGNGWAKRMALNAGEIGTGAALLAGPSLPGGLGLFQRAGGVALVGAGLFGGMWNTGSAIKNGLTPKDAVLGIGHLAGSAAKTLGRGAADLGHRAWEGASQISHTAALGVSGLGNRLIHSAATADYDRMGPLCNHWAH